MDEYSQDYPAEYGQEEHVYTGEELSGYEDYAPEQTAQKPSKKKKKRRRKHYFLRFCIFCALVFGLYYFLNSDFFAVRKFEVTGNQYYTPAQIIEMSGLQSGVNMFFETKTRPARNALLEDPYIRLAEIKRKPKDTIQIVIEERREYAAVPYGEQFVLIDREGTVLRVADEEPALPILGNMSITEMTPGKALQVEQAYLLTDTLSLLNLVEENDIYFKRIDFSTVIIRAYIYDDLYCEGAPANIRDNMASIQKLLQELYKEEITRGVIRVGTDNYLSYSPSF
ncbi:MAG: FtsQ-type POTRA domain-containing protein [Firmicutes bacterium]|nr:FtsQ-type POTRA domain-containing protein [Bacillota bacterium]MBR3748487.1 FtsQ-type POTRA domain-containing protein [Bacillota bacterium]